MGKNNQQRRRSRAKTRRAGRSQTAAQRPDASSRSSAQPPHAASAEEPLENRVSALVSRAVQARELNRHSEFHAAVDQLVSLSEPRTGRRTVVRALSSMLHSGVTRAWQSGWQPADLVRLARRRLGTGEQSLLSDAVANELATYSASTLDPRWPAQLQEADARVWWPSDQSHLDARQAIMGWAAVIPSALRVLHLLWGLPALEQLGPLPGTARPSSSTSRGPGAPEVDERILSRVRALLAKAESTTFEAEAETFTAGAQALMARHSIDAALLAATHDGRAGAPAGRRVGIDNPYEAPKAMLLAAVADANRCRTVWSRELGFATVIGFDRDVDAVETLFTSLLVQATRALTREGSRTDRYGRSRTRAFRQSFLSAFAARIGERLREVTQTETDAAVAKAGQSGGRELVPVLAARSEAVDEAFQKMFPNLSMHSVGVGSDAEGWYSGRSAADRAAIGGDTALE